MADKMLGRIPQSTPEVSWFEFLLDKTGKLLKDHISTKNADPSAMQLCRQFLQKCIHGYQSANSMVSQPLENERNRQLQYLALVVASYIKWDLDEITDSLPFNFQYRLMTELLRNYGLSENAVIEDFKPENMDKRVIVVWILFHRWILHSIVKIVNKKRAERGKLRNSSVNNSSQDEHLIPMLYGYLPQSLKILNNALCLSDDLEIPFPSSLSDSKSNQSNEASGAVSLEKNVEQNLHPNELSTVRETAIVQNDTKTDNVFDQSIPLKVEHFKMHIYADLGTFHFFKEDYHDALRNFSQLFELHKKSGNEMVINNWTEIKGCFLACNMICKIPYAVESVVQHNLSVMLKMEKCIKKNFEGFYALLREDNLKRELPLMYRRNLEEVVVTEQRKDLLFTVCVCNAIRTLLLGNLLSTAFLKSLKFAKNEEIVLLAELCLDVLSTSPKRIEIDYLKRSLKTIMRFLPTELRATIENDKRVSLLFSCKEGLKNLDAEISCQEDRSITAIKTAESILLEAVSGLNLKDDPQFIKREIALSTNPDYLKQLVAQLSVLPNSKESFKSFQCAQYSDLLSEIRDPMTHALLHVLIRKARTFAGKQDLNTSLGLLTNALEVLSQSMQPVNTAHANRVKNIIHHEMLSAKVQWEQQKTDASINIDTLRLCKACYHHKEQDPLPKKQIYRDIVSYLLNNKEWQFLIDERGNTEGITDFRELGYQVANVSVGLSKAGDAVRKHADELWSTVIKIACEDLNSGSQPLMAFERSSQGTRRSPAIVTRKDLIIFIGTLKNNTVVSVLTSCLVSIVNQLKSTEQIELKALYSHIWPTELDLEKTDGKREQFLSILKPLLEKIVSLDTRNIAWLRNKAEIFIVEGKHREAMKQFLQVGAMTSSLFSVPVPFHAWDDQVLRRMIDCSLEQKLFSQAVVLAQFVEPVDYPTVLKAIQENGRSSDLIDTTYRCLWDPTILEFIIYAHSKRGEIEKKQLAIKTLTKSELNSCNYPDTLKQTADIRKCEFLRFLTRFYWN